MKYEIIAIFSGALKPSETKAAVKKTEEEISKFAKIEKTATWENKELAYKIGKDTQGTYKIYLVEVEDQTKIPEFQSYLRLEPTVIRDLVTKTPKNYEWVEYDVADLEHDYTKLDRDLYNEKDSKKPAKK